MNRRFFGGICLFVVGIAYFLSLWGRASYLPCFWGVVAVLSRCCFCAGGLVADCGMIGEQAGRVRCLWGLRAGRWRLRIDQLAKIL